MPYYLIEGQGGEGSDNYQCTGPIVNEGTYKNLDCQTAYKKELEKTGDDSIANNWCDIAPECTLNKIDDKIDNQMEIKYKCDGPIVNEGTYKNLNCQTAYNKELEKTDDISMANKWCNIAPECNLTQIPTDDNKNPTNITNISLQEQLNNLEQKLSDNLTSVLMDNLDKINDTITDKSKLYDSNDSRSGEYINKIKNMTSIYDLGDPNNSDELDFLENITINFLDIPNNRMGDLFNENYCNGDFNVTILLSLAVFYNNSDDSKGKTVNVDRLLNRLGRYLPDVFQKILTGMKTCYPDEPNKYAVLEHIYKKMFKFNETNVDLGLMDGVTNIFRYLKEMKTIEMVVIIIAFAFVVSKIFDMFRVKVDV